MIPVSRINARTPLAFVQLLESAGGVCETFNSPFSEFIHIIVRQSAHPGFAKTAGPKCIASNRFAPCSNPEHFCQSSD